MDSAKTKTPLATSRRHFSVSHMHACQKPSPKVQDPIAKEQDAMLSQFPGGVLALGTNLDGLCFYHKIRIYLF